MDIHITTHGDQTQFALNGVMSFRDKDAFTPVLDLVSGGGGRQVTIDLSGLQQVDSFGIGLLLLANEQAVAAGTRLRLVNPRGAVARVFELADLDAVMTLDKADATPAPAPRRVGIGYRRLPDRADGARCVGLRGRLVFAEHAAFQEIIDILLDGSAPELVLDLSELDFMDSAGLSMIMIAREEAETRGQRLVLRSPQGAVARLLNLSALEFMLEN